MLRTIVCNLSFAVVAAVPLSSAQAQQPPAAPAPASAPAPAPAPAPQVESSRADDGNVEEKSLTPTDEASRGLWYKPSPDELRPATRTEYIPFALMLEPQVVTGGVRGGTLTTLQVNVPLSPSAGVVMGGQFADAPRFIFGFDFLRYVGYELPLTKTGGNAISVIFAPTFGAEAFYGGSAVGGDFWVAPVGLRGLIDAVHAMVELRAAGHVYFGTELNSFGSSGGSDNELSRASFAGTLGLQLTVAPLFAKRTVALSAEAHDQQQSAPATRRAPRDDSDDSDEEPEPTKKKKKKKPDNDDARAPGGAETARVANVPVTWGGAQ